MVQYLPRILVRFHLEKIAITLDIDKAFLQIGLQPEDSDDMRFLYCASAFVWNFLVGNGA